MKSIFGEKDRLLRQSQLYLSKNQFKDAETLLLKYMESNPDHFGQLYLALSIHQQNRTDEALGILQDIIKQKPKEPEVFLYHRALLLFDKNTYIKCIVELNKIKEPNHFHTSLKSIAEVFDDLSKNSHNYNQAYETLKKCKSMSQDLQARVLFKLESFLPINLSKRAHSSSIPSQWQPIIFTKQRILEKNNKQQELINQALTSAESGEFTVALELMESCFEMNINSVAVEKVRLKISELLLAKMEISLGQVGEKEIAWAFFYTQQFQKGIEFCTPFLQAKESLAKHATYIDLLDITAYLHFCLGNFSAAEKLLLSKMELDPKDSEQAAYYYAACLQHSKQHFEAINAYKNFISNYLDGYTIQLNCAMKTIAPELIIT